MGRQIKFRAWVKRVGGREFGRMAKVIGMYGNYNSALVRGIDCAIDGLVSVDDIELMQFTGLYDDNGDEIYEGDIVEIRNANETKTSYKSIVKIAHSSVIVSAHPIHIKIDVGCDRLLSEFCNYGDGDIYNVDCKIIGNIYENKELLEELQYEYTKETNINIS